MNTNIDYRSLPQGNFPARNIDRNATQQSPQRNPKREFDYRLIQPKIQNLNASSNSLSRLRSDTPITIRGQNYRYVGQMNGNQKEGVGSYFTNELEYEGEWRNNVYHGFGKFYQEGKLSYQGQFKNGLKNGAGIEYYEDDSYFVGNFEKNQKNGIGTLYKKNEKISGIWQNDKLIEKY
ncbi:unnamed protein product [Paramecium primaurelia]|uniref:MORN repeat protein n=2 Tax=Paramecium TaxID=5884 RepID=A0A8S1V4I8_9CILI|nr:unnamed protein product [Paramecium primaurelia]CAD8170689.1 unnamed protein product [Paramecium pentaurelia]